MNGVEGKRCLENPALSTEKDTEYIATVFWYKATFAIWEDQMRHANGKSFV